MAARKKSTAKTKPKPKPESTRRREDAVLRLIGRGVVSPILYDATGRAGLGLPADEETKGPYLVELNVQYRGGLAEAVKAFERMFEDLFGVDVPEPELISKSYLKVMLSVDEWRRMIAHDERVATKDPYARVIYKLWPDFEVKPLVDRSVATVKADAAFRAYSASGDGVTWAVVDSGIDGTHPHFGTRDEPLKSVLHHPNVAQLHRDFTPGAAAGPPRRGTLPSALVDEYGHGTHVAGVIAGQLPADSQDAPARASRTPRGGRRKRLHAVFEQVFSATASGAHVPGERLPARRAVHDATALRGVAPRCLLVSLKVMDANGNGHVSDVMRALAYVREKLNDAPKLLRVHGVNLSIGYEFDAQMFACGQSPLCVEVDRLVRSGVVVVVAAGNTGYGAVAAAPRLSQTGLSNTINDPGNAALAITVGATHRDSPHTYGVSFFSSKGPTGDGRLKPDLVAPGERITSCASGGRCRAMGIAAPAGAATYVDDSGTSLAAPHVSGAIAAFLSIRREFIQRPEDVKRIFLESATSLGRERYFEGHGLVDLMRAIQSV